MKRAYHEPDAPGSLQPVTELLHYGDEEQITNEYGEGEKKEQDLDDETKVIAYERAALLLHLTRSSKIINDRQRQQHRLCGLIPLRRV